MASAIDAAMIEWNAKTAAAHPNSEFGRFLREERIDAPSLPPDLATRLIAWTLAAKEQEAKEHVRALSSEEKWLLDSFIERKVPGRRINFDSEVEFIGEWQSTRAKRTTDRRKDFPVFDLDYRLFHDLTPISDPHEARYYREINAAFIKAHPPLARLQSEGWNLDQMDPAALGPVLDVLSQPLPGKEPRLTYFFDPKAPDHDVATGKLTAAWRKRSDVDPAYLLHDDIGRFLTAARGSTVILVGHIADQYFAMERGPGRPPLMLDIPELMRRAVQYDVLLVPVGCNSARGGAPFGFTRTIDTVEVAKFIEAIPSGDLLVADVLAALGAIGPITVDPARLHEQIDVIAHQASDSTGEPVTLVRLPGSAHAGPGNAGVSTPQSGYQEFAADWMAANRPFLDRGWLASLRSFVRHTRGAGMLSTALALGGLYCVLRLVRRRVEGTTAVTGTYFHMAEIWVALAAIVLAVIAILYALLAALWGTPLGIGLFWAFVLFGAVVSLKEKFEEFNKEVP